MGPGGPPGWHQPPHYTPPPVWHQPPQPPPTAAPPMWHQPPPDPLGVDRFSWLTTYTAVPDGIMGWSNLCCCEQQDSSGRGPSVGPSG
ncbi:hypothetical protein QYF36_009313 [Acer negundo]|nr:hypothetical protein QYF36_009313 [Acer negundo]